MMRNYTQIPNVILDRFIPAKLKNLHMRILCHLYRHSSGVRRTSTIDKKLSTSNKSRIVKALKELEEMGFIRIWRQGNRNQYELRGRDFDESELDNIGISGEYDDEGNRVLPKGDYISAEQVDKVPEIVESLGEKEQVSHRDDFRFDEFDEAEEEESSSEDELPF